MRKQKWEMRGKAERTLKTSRTARVCTPGCLYARLRSVPLVPLSGVMEAATSILRPFASWLSISTSERRVLDVVQALVSVRPCGLDEYLASMSPAIRFDLLSRAPETLNATPDGVVVVLTSSVVAVKG